MDNPQGVNNSNHRRAVSSRVALAALILSIIAADVAIFSGVGHHIGLWHFRTALAVFRYSGYLALISGTVSAAALFMILRGGGKNHKMSVVSGALGLAVSVAVMAVILYWYAKAVGLPRIHDITTDVEMPPRFTAVLALRKDAANSPEYGGRAVADEQKRAYPDIVPLDLGLGREEAFEAAFKGVKGMGWEIVYSDPVEGRIEATDETFWFGFKDDIIVRVTARKGGSRIDVRSASRLGISDVGKNAGRIREYLRKVREVLGQRVNAGRDKTP